MKKVLVSALVLMSVSTAAFAQADNRSAWAKSQDMYVEPTLRVKQTEIYTPVDANSVPSGQSVVTSETVQVYGPNGQVLNAMVTPTPTAVPAVQTPAATAPATELQPAVQDLSRPLQ